VSTDPKVAKLLAPLTEPEDALAPRRIVVDREKLVSRMVEASRAPEERFGRRTRVAAALAVAASVALASWGGERLYRRDAASASGMEVLALRGSVTRVSGTRATGLAVGEAVNLDPGGSLETARSAEARIRTGAGVDIVLAENTRISPSEQGVASTSSVLRLEHGRVRCVVPHRPGRTFTVVTNAARVIDIGTIFSVSVMPSEAGPTTVVHVEEGEVLVEFAGGRRYVRAAQSWTSAGEASLLAPAAAPADSTLAPTPVAPRPLREPVKRPTETLDAETKLLRSGLVSEQRGDFRAAAEAFQTLVARYPESQLAPDAKAALLRVRGRQGSSK
jgi:hypothetical protein